MFAKLRSSLFLKILNTKYLLILNIFKTFSYIFSSSILETINLTYKSYIFAKPLKQYI